MKNIEGFIHSRETFGAVDGPGIRYVLFMQGCNLRCKYCHNPDTWNSNDGKKVFSKDIVREINDYRSFIKNGGVTISGGEPLLQPSFVKEVLRGCKDLGFHTAIDTAGAVPLEDIKSVLQYTDLVLLDIKCLDDVVCTELTGYSNKNALNLLDYCESISMPVWIRHVLVPQITLNRDLLQDLANYAQKFSCVKKIELLPFHKMGEYKWEELGYKYNLKNTEIPSKDDIALAKEIFIAKGLSVQ